MSRYPDFPRGFSLVEVTLALGIAAFCLIALLGLIPLGMQTNQSAVSQTAAASILSSVVADLRATANATQTSAQYDITFGTAKLLYVDDQGRAVSPTEPTAAPRYRVMITFPASPEGLFAPTFVSLKITWPALADPATTPPAGFVEMFAALNRY